MKRSTTLALAALILAPGAAYANTYTVGNGTSCTNGNLQSAINSAQANPGPDYIRIDQNFAPAAQALSVGQQDLVFIGGYLDCSEFSATGGTTTISGLGGSAAPVFTITGSGVKEFYNINIVRGDNSNTQAGGGIRYEGHGDLILSNVGIASNQAGAGAGIFFKSDGEFAVLTLKEGTVVQLNTATNTDGAGAGIEVLGNAYLKMLEDRTTIVNNTATGSNSRGGGLYLGAPARADIGSPGYLNYAAIDSNEAADGGGVALVATTDGEDPRLRMFGTRLDRPVRLHGNRARRNGGAIFTKPYEYLLSGGGVTPHVCLTSAHVDGNQAREGAVAYLGTDDGTASFDKGGDLIFNRQDLGSYATYFCSGDPIASLGAVECTRNVAGCNVIENNAARDLGTNQITDGSIFYGDTESYLVMGSVRIVNNIGFSMLRARSDNYVALSNCLVANNATDSDVVRVDSGHQLYVGNCTFAGNSIGGGSHVIRRDGNADIDGIVRNLFWQPGSPSLLYGGDLSGVNSPKARWNSTNDRGDLPDDPYNQVHRARFVDAEHGDFHLRIGSDAVDFAPSGGGRDLDDRAPDQSQPIYHFDPIFGRRQRDSGAFERQINDPWIDNGDFNGNLYQWTLINATDVTYDATTATGSPGGSLRVGIGGTPSPLRATAASYCFAVPAGGTYRISGAGRTIGIASSLSDTPLIHWRLRYNSETCTGVANADGNLYLPNASTFQTAAVTAAVGVPNAQWTPNTTIQIDLDVIENSPAVTTSLNAGFDAIRIVADNDLIFRDGYERLP